MIRVLHVFGIMDRGGAETMIMNVYRHIDKTRVQFDFVVHKTKPGAYDEEIRSLGGQIFYVPSFTGTNMLSYKKAWFVLLSSHPEWHILHCHIRSTASWIIPIAKKCGMYTIAHSHSISSGKGFIAITKNLLQLPIRRQADCLMACSKKAGEWLFGKRAVKEDHIVLFHNAIDTLKYSFDCEIRGHVREQLHVEDNYVVGHVGRFEYPKNHKFIIEIFDQLTKRMDNAKLLLVGDGSLLEEVKTYVKTKGLEDKILFAGLRDDVNQMMQAMDLFLFPSIFEGFPLTLIEAQSEGLQILGSDRITRETAITDLISFHSIMQSPSVWAQIALEKSTTKTNRVQYAQVVKDAGFDIKENVAWLESFYLSRTKRGNNAITTAG